VFIDRGSGFLCTQSKPNPSKEFNLLITGFGLFKCVLRLPSKSVKSIECQGFEVKNWSSLYCFTPEKKRNSILYLTYHFFEGKNAIYIFLIFALTMIFNWGSKSYLASDIR
jgi:hypothetical protein